MPNRRGHTNDRLSKEYKRQTISDRGVICFMDQVGELNQQVLDLQVDLGQARYDADQYKARAEAEQVVTEMYKGLLAKRTRWLYIYMATALGVSIYMLYIVLSIH